MGWRLQLHVGGMLTPRLAVLAELWAVIAPREECRRNVCETDAISQVNVGIAAQFWITRRFWLKGGFGTSKLVEEPGQGDADGIAISGAIGFEVFSSPYLAIDVQLRGAIGSYKGLDDRIGQFHVQVGFSWF